MPPEPSSLENRRRCKRQRLLSEVKNRHKILTVWQVFQGDLNSLPGEPGNKPREITKSKCDLHAAKSWSCWNSAGESLSH